LNISPEAGVSRFLRGFIMENTTLSAPDPNGIIPLSPGALSAENHGHKKSFGHFAWIYDLAQKYWVRPRIHKADPRRHGEILSNMLKPFQKCRVLDVACGTGAAMAYLDKSNHYTGLDLSYSMLKRAVKKGRKKKFAAARFIHGNAEEPLFAKGAFDLVVMDTALHLIPVYDKALAETARILKHGGTFVCSVPILGIDARFDARWKDIMARSGVHGLTLEKLEQACANHRLIFSHHASNGGVLYSLAQKG